MKHVLVSGSDIVVFIVELENLMEQMRCAKRVSARDHDLTSVALELRTISRRQTKTTPRKATWPSRRLIDSRQ